VLAAAATDGIHTTLSPVFKTPQELAYGSPLFLDMTGDVLILHDPDGVLERYLRGLRARLRAPGRPPDRQRRWLPLAVEAGPEAGRGFHAVTKSELARAFPTEQYSEADAARAIADAAEALAAARLLIDGQA
jgi:hypothetical protein